MSVIIKDLLRNEYKSFVKGSPEKIRELCLQESLPPNFDEILQVYTEKGYRVIAIAYKNLGPSINYLETQKI